MHLRPYQEEALTAIYAAWKRHADVLLVAATGAGKTNLFLTIAMDVIDADPTARVLVIAHRRELISQPLDRVRKMNPAWLARAADRPRIGVIMAGKNENDRQLTIATVQSLSAQRVADMLAHGVITHLIIDECHHATAPTYLRVYQELKQINPDLKHLGVTATPLRADGDGLARVYQTVAARITIADLVKQHYLVQPRWLGISTGMSIKGVATSNGDFNQGQLAKIFDTPRGRDIIIGAYQQYASGRQFIAFTAGVAGAHDLSDAFNAVGVKTLAIDGTTPKDVRDRALELFKSKAVQGLINCQVLTEGFDAPGTNAILMCRPTKSDGNYIQAMGRGLRPAEKPHLAGEDRYKAQPGEDCLILDFLPAETRNIVMAGDVLGLPKEVTRKATEKKEPAEPGAVQGGFTFDGESFRTDGTPLEIVARQLDYLQASPFRWFERDGWLVLGLGVASDNNDRLLVVPPPRNGAYTLYGALRAVTEYDGRKHYGSWRTKPLTTDIDLAAIGTHAHGIAEKWGAGVLIGKGRSWHAQPASEGQQKYLRRLCNGELKFAEIKGMTKGAVAGLIDYYQAREALKYIELEQAEEVAA